MIYVIDNKIIYNTATHIVQLVEEKGRNAKLSKSASLLFEELLKNHNMLMKREQLIENVLENNGYSGSSISLSVAMSEIRRAFKDLEQEIDIIKTIRKEGFQLNASVIQYQSDITHNAPLLIKIKHNNPIKALTKFKHILLLITLATSLTFMISKQFFSSKHFIQENGVYNLGMYKKCNIFFVSKSSPAHSLSMKTIITDEIRKRNLNCSKKQADVFFLFFNKIFSHSPLISICYKYNSSSYEKCVTHHQLTSEMPD